jgi:uncharacterized protein
MRTAYANLPLASAGLGLRRALLGSLQTAAPGAIDYLECAPDNWIGVGGRYGEAFSDLARRFPISCHGLSLNLGGFIPFDETYLLRLRNFLDQHKVPIYSEHLSYCADHGQLYDLMPIPFTEQAVKHVADRIRHVQDRLGRRIAIENVSFYAAPYKAMDEISFVSSVLDAADCDLLLDVNNVYVNSINHSYDPIEFIRAMPSKRVVHYHIAGHYDEADDLKVDTHGADVKQSVWDLLHVAYQTHGVQPTLLERDFNFPAFDQLLSEVNNIRYIQQQHSAAYVSQTHA